MATGRANRQELEGDLQAYTLTRLTTEFPPRALVAHLTSLICLRHLNDDELLHEGPDSLTQLARLGIHLDPANDMLQDEVAAVHAEWFPAQVDELVEAAWGTTKAFERVLELRERLGATDLAAARLAPELVRLVTLLTNAVAVADRDPEGTVRMYDPYAGAGDLLVAAAATLREDQPVYLTARSNDAYLARLIRRRLAVHDLHDGGFAVHNDQADHDGADIIITQLPYQPAESRSVGESLQLLDDIAVQLRPGAAAVVVAPADTTGVLTPPSTAAHHRAELISGNNGASGVVRAVIRLPGGLVPYRPGYEVAVWVLGTDHHSRRGEILLADVSDRPLTSAVVDALVTDVVAWSTSETDRHTHAYIHAIRTSIQSLANAPWALVPRHKLTEIEFVQGVPERVARALDLERVLQEARPSWPRLPSHVELARTPSPTPAKTVDELTKGGRQRTNVLSLRKGTRIRPEHVRSANYLRSTSSVNVIGTPELTGRCALGERRIDRLELAASYPSAQLTQPGDVIVAIVPEPAVLVDHEGYSMVQYPARILRITERGAIQFTPRVLAALLRQQPRPRGAIRAVQRIEEIRLPILQTDDVARLDRLLAELDERRHAADRERTALDQLQHLVTRGIADGTLTLTDNATH
ncbi:hypothetical protein C5E43_08830 [Nocardia cyriacigeorgica]|nr:hypothetical protein C5E43_08830 [Nocardia cyriacigeorgica]